MTDPTNTPHDSSLDEGLRPHVFDGIQEYDKRLPRWWLLTLYGTVAFAVVYWAYYHAYHIGTPPTKALDQEMAANAAAAAQKGGSLDDDTIYKLSHDSAAVAAGKTTFNTLCFSCHQLDLTGAIGPNLKDKEWIHGGKPMDAFKTVFEGVLAKGMPEWGKILGRQKATEVVAYIFSFHSPGEEVKIVPGWTPRPLAMPVPPPPPAQ